MHRKGLVLMERGRIGYSAVQSRARVHALLGLHSEIICGVTAAGDPVTAGVHVVGVLLAMAVHGVVLGHMSIHGSVHRGVLVGSVLVVRVDTIPHVVTPIAVVRVGDVMGRVHNLRAAVGVFEQLCELPPCEIYAFMVIGGGCPRLSHISSGLGRAAGEKNGKRPAELSTSVSLRQSRSGPDKRG